MIKSHCEEKTKNILKLKTVQQFVSQLLLFSGFLGVFDEFSEALLLFLFPAAALNSVDFMKLWRKFNKKFLFYFIFFSTHFLLGFTTKSIPSLPLSHTFKTPLSIHQ